MTTQLGSEVLRRAAALELIGQMAGSGYREPPFLVRRADGQTLQLTQLLFLTLEAIDGRREVADVAAAVSTEYGRPVSADNVRTLIDDHLRPLGLLTKPDGSEPELKRSDPLLGLRYRVAVTDPARTRQLTAPFTVLFRSFVVLPMLALFAVVCWWVFLEKGLASATYDAFQHPGLLIFVFVVTLLSAGFHEFGHAAAARYGGATPGVMGAGVYLIFPAFYTDVTDSYRLGRRGRLRTDLGGLYFNALVAVVITGAWWATGYDALLLVVATQILQMIGQLTPLVRFDGYHVLADLTGVPDLFRRIKPTLLGLLPWRWNHPETRVLKPWARMVVTLWVVLVVPLLILTLGILVLTLPRIAATAWAKLGDEQQLLSSAWTDGDLVQVAARGLVMVAVAFPVLAIGLLLGRLGIHVARSVWRRTAGRPVRRSIAGLTAGLVAAGLAWAWWPDGRTYRPITPDDRGTLVDGMTQVADRARPAPALSAPALEPGSRGELRVVWDTGQPLPTEAEPQLALVLIPHGPVAGGSPEAWVFPFTMPLAPEPGDNQALAVNTDDGTITYDVAVSLVWVTDGDTALNTNEAYAFASCETCASVAIAFQVVLVVGDNDTAVPQNLAGALNYNCVNCLTYALAQQLFITLEGPLSAEAMEALDAVWAELALFAEEIESYPLDEVDGLLDDFSNQILAIIEADQPGTVPTTSPSPTEPATTQPTELSSPTDGLSPTEGETTSSPEPSATPTETPEPTDTAAPEPSASDTSTP